jgi:Calcineurin-like phosphoesterase
MSPDLWIVGDVQGFLEPLRRVLTRAGLIDASGAWTGGGATLAVLGDLVDRGPDGVGVIELLMRLQAEAGRSDGQVQVVIGNHDVLLLAVRKFPTEGTFRETWRLSGGQDSDLVRLRGEHVDWLERLPAMLLEADVLMAHADALFYLEYGSGLADVNDGFASALRGRDADAYQRLLTAFTEHRAFLGPDGCAKLDRFLGTFGGQRLVHGHTPIPRMTRQPPETAISAYVYCGGRCVNVDPGLYLGGPGFAYRV